MMGWLLFALFLLLAPGAPEARAPGADHTIVVEDFESYDVGAIPAKWEYFSRRERKFISIHSLMAEDEDFRVASEKGNKFLRVYTRDEAHRISMGNGRGALHWDLRTHSTLNWRWRAQRLPAGAREDRTNDSGGAVYVTFKKKDWMGRPLSIKYTYSSSLKPGATVNSGNVKIIVVSSGAEPIGKWQRVERDVAADYSMLFGGDAPSEPFSITLWSDSDDTGSEAEVDFDDVRLLP